VTTLAFVDKEFEGILQKAALGAHLLAVTRIPLADHALGRVYWGGCLVAGKGPAS